MKRRKIKAPIKQEKTPSTTRKIIVTVILLIIAFSGAFLIYFVMQVALNTDTPMVVVVSESMEPNLLIGDLLFLKGDDPDNIKEGDIIVFDAFNIPGWIKPPPEPIVHRVINKKYDNGWFFLTKGDHNSDPDNYPHIVWVPETFILGVVVGRIPYIGWVKIILTDSGLLIPLLVIVSALLVISVIWDLVKKEKDGSESDKKGIYDEKEIKQVIEIDFTKT